MTYCHDGFDLPGPMVLRTGRPHFLRDAEPGESEAAFAKRRARELDALLRREGAETVAAFVGEPVMGSGGVFLPPDGYWDAIQEVLATHDVLLIADEVITGFGRTGTWFGCERYGIRPDLMTLAKQLSGAYAPISAVGVSDAVMADVARAAHDRGTLGHGFTYGGHPVAVAVAREAIAIYREMDLPAHVGRLAPRLDAALAPCRALPGVDDVRSIGLIGAVEMREGLGAPVGREAEARGVLVRVIGDVLAVSPPLNVTEAEIERIGATLAESIAAAVATEPA